MAELIGPIQALLREAGDIIAKLSQKCDVAEKALNSVADAAALADANQAKLDALLEREKSVALHVVSLNKEVEDLVARKSRLESDLATIKNRL